MTRLSTPQKHQDHSSAIQRLSLPRALFFSSTLLLSACGNMDEESLALFWIDNPTEREITLTIDHNTLIIPAESGKELKLPAGKHQLTFQNESRYFMVKPLSKVRKTNSQRTSYEIVLNPTQSEYAIYHLPYRDDDTPWDNDTYHTAMEGHLYQFIFKEDEAANIQVLPLQFTQALFIDQALYEWDYDLQEPLPKAVEFDAKPQKTSASDSFKEDFSDKNYIVKTKLYRINDFYREIAGAEHLEPAPSISKPLSSLAAFRLTPTTIESECPLLASHLKEIEQAFNHLPEIPLGNKAHRAFQDFQESTHLKLNTLESRCLTASGSLTTSIPEIEESFQSLNLLLKSSAYLLPYK